MAGLSSDAAQATQVPSHHHRHPHPEVRTLASIATRVLLTAAACGVLATIVALVAGCASVAPDSIVEPAPSKQAQATSQAAMTPAMNGAIYAADNFRPMFEDRRARLIGDTLIISIAEKTSAGKNVASSSSKDSKTDVMHGAVFGGLDLESSNALSNADKAAANAANNFTGTVTATVVEVLPNGNLKVRGEKQVAFDRSTEFIRFSGVVNPATISSTNTVPSTSVADMRVEYRTNSNFDRSALQSALARFFLSILPL